MNKCDDKHHASILEHKNATLTAPEGQRTNEGSNTNTGCQLEESQVVDVRTGRTQRVRQELRAGVVLLVRLEMDTRHQVCGCSQDAGQETGHNHDAWLDETLPETILYCCRSPPNKIIFCCFSKTHSNNSGKDCMVSLESALKVA